MGGAVVCDLRTHTRTHTHAHTLTHRLHTEYYLLIVISVSVKQVQQIILFISNKVKYV